MKKVVNYRLNFKEFSTLSTKIMAAGSKYVGVWQWVNNQKEWKSYPQEQCKVMDVLSNGEKYEFEVGSNQYEFIKISNIQGQQRNRKSGTKRTCRRIEMKKEKVRKSHKRKESVASDKIWQYKTDDGSWKTYNYEHLLKMQSLKTDESFDFVVGKNKYRFRKLTDTIGMQQNLKTRKQRECRKMDLKTLQEEALMKHVVNVSDVETIGGYHEEQTCLIQ